MHRFAVVLLLATACTSSPSFRPATLPPLAVATPPTKLISAKQLLLNAGEHFSYEVHLHGVTIGRLDLEVTDVEVVSKFKTDSLASAFAMVEDDSVTTLDRTGARAAGSTETLVVGSDAKTFTQDSSAAGNPGQTALTALGLLRAWAKPDATAGFLLVYAAGKVWRLDLSRPTTSDLQGTAVLRIDGRVRAEKPIAFVLWLSASDDRTPLRIELSNDEFHVVADLVRE
jgi:hypothetical protein